MRQLSGIDASFLNMETESVFGHVSSLTIYDPTGVPGGASVDTMKAAILERLDQLRPLRQRLREVPLGLDLPYWVDDDRFDIDFHVRHHGLPKPGSAEQLADAVSRIHARPLDRSRPLWELYVIEGYDHGRYIAQLTKVHHATIDGASGAMMLAAILDLEATTTIGPPAVITPARQPSDADLLLRTLASFVRSPERVMRLSLRAARELRNAQRAGSGLAAIGDLVAQPIPGPFGDFLRGRLRSDTDPDRPPALPRTAAPKTPWNASIGRHRRFAFTSMPLETVKAIRRAVGCTFNDVVMAVCSGALRRYLLRHECLPPAPLIAFVPVSVRTGGEDDTYQNRVSGLLADLATNEADPLARLRRVSESMAAAKQQLGAIPAEALTDFTRFAPPVVAARAMRMYSRLRIADRTAPPFNLIISNVPGPAQPLYAGGAKLEHFYPVSAVADGQGLNITVQSYNGTLDFGLVADRDLVADLWDLITMIHEAIDELVAAIAAASTDDEPTTTRPSPTAKRASTRAASKRAATQAPSKRAAAPTTQATGKRATRAPAKRASRPTTKGASSTRPPAAKQASAPPA